ncbi:MAG: hypothetical protein LBH79_04935 [Nitrososphaerota archaeon]|jgi:hypothetical protein|nr:hypothetical protein [Nitrososphaerota archaeon]
MAKKEKATFQPLVRISIGVVWYFATKYLTDQTAQKRRYFSVCESEFLVKFTGLFRFTQKITHKTIEKVKTTVISAWRHLEERTR